LVSLRRPPGAKPAAAEYRTTDRFLRLFGLDDLGQLPRSDDLDRT
jgi:chromosome segregation and condensation protein ScpB